MDWSAQLAAQLSWHWEAQLRPRLEGLSDEEYLWAPVSNAWTIRPVRDDDPPDHPGADWTIDFTWPPPDPAPVTTIAWRIAHLLVGVFGVRNARYFGGPPVDEDSYDYPQTAADALRRLDEAYAIWIAGVHSLGNDGLAHSCRESGRESDPMAALVLHIHREVIHHGAEISLLRDLHAVQTSASAAP